MPVQIPSVACSPVFQSLSDALPNQSVVEFIKIHDSKGNFSNAKTDDTSQVRQMASSTKTLEDLRIVLVKMIAWAKILDHEYALRDEIYAISGGLGESKWEAFPISTDIISYSILAGSVSECALSFSGV